MLSLRQKRKVKVTGNILIVDDEPHFRFAAGIALKSAGHEVSEAEDGEKALNMILDRGDHRFDLLLVDVQMPNMTGLELIDELQKRSIGLPVFVVSGFNDQALMNELHGKGCSDFLCKPFEPKLLVQKIGALLKRAEGAKG
jgi:DNA-binding response OmpR family regulator